MLDVAKHIVEGYLIHRKLTDIRETKEEKEDRRVTYKPYDLFPQTHVRGGRPTFPRFP